MSQSILKQKVPTRVVGAGDHPQLKARPCRVSAGKPGAGPIKQAPLALSAAQLSNTSKEVDSEELLKSIAPPHVAQHFL
jgi:hypothetical protein